MPERQVDIGGTDDGDAAGGGHVVHLPRTGPFGYDLSLARRRDAWMPLAFALALTLLPGQAPAGGSTR